MGSLLFVAEHFNLAELLCFARVDPHRIEGRWAAMPWRSTSPAPLKFLNRQPLCFVFISTFVIPLARSRLFAQQDARESSVGVGLLTPRDVQCVRKFSARRFHPRLCCSIHSNRSERL